MQKYLITSREFYTDTPAVFRSILHEQLREHLPEFALYRDKANPDYDIQASHFVEVCSQFESTKSFIHQKVDLAKKLNATGVHLTSKQFDEVEYALSQDLEVIISTHSKQEVKEAQKLGATYVTYSPIFASPNKGEPKGVKDLTQLVKEVDIKVFALGGIVSEDEVEEVKMSKCFGYASIRGFY